MRFSRWFSGQSLDSSFMVVVARPAFKLTCLLGSAFFCLICWPGLHATRVPLGRTASDFSVDVQLESIEPKSKRCLGGLQAKKAAFSFPSWLTSPLSFQIRKYFSFVSRRDTVWLHISTCWSF